MRALCLTATGGPDQLASCDIPAPTLTDPGEVRVAIRAVALNHLDLWVAEGLPAVPIPSFPHVVGADGAGVVIEVGAAVTHVAVGDRVVINPGVSCGHCDACIANDEPACRDFSLLGEHRPGTAAEQVVLPGRNVLPIRGEWTWAEAAAFSLVTLTAWRMLVHRARVERDEVVLIWGAGGGVATQAMQIARHLGARVAVTSSSDDKLARSTELGAELLINHRSAPDVPAAVKTHFGRRADVVVDTVGAPTWDRSLKSLRPGGRYVTLRGNRRARGVARPAQALLVPVVDPRLDDGKLARICRDRRARRSWPPATRDRRRLSPRRWSRCVSAPGRRTTVR